MVPALPWRLARIDDTDKNGVAGQKAGTTARKGYTCTCDSPCSGSKTCPNGCYAFCEENPENSGRYVCIKGCASEAPAVKGKKLDPRKKYATVNLSIPREQVMALMIKLYGRKNLQPITDQGRCHGAGEYPAAECRHGGADSGAGTVKKQRAKKITFHEADIMRVQRTSPPAGFWAVLRWAII